MRINGVQLFSMTVTAVVMVLAVEGARVAGQQRRQIDVYKSATCGCCENWVEHLKEQGFDPVPHTVEAIEPVKTKFGVPRAVFSCHTAVIDGYVIEGHVPAADIDRLLKQRPAVMGLAVPGMPVGSPGMEGKNPKPYDVLTFDNNGTTQVFSSHRP